MTDKEREAIERIAVALEDIVSHLKAIEEQKKRGNDAAIQYSKDSQKRWDKQTKAMAFRWPWEKIPE